MKIVELKEVPKEKSGRVTFRGSHLEAYEYDTVLYLIRFGFDIEIIKPANIPGSNNPDILMLGTAWEIKTLETSNRKTIKKRIHKASLQSNHIVFDLRKVDKKYAKEIQKDIIDRFTSKRTLRHMILISNSGEALDIQK